MKIKQDFVTNSSSTSFTFIFKGSDKWDLYRELFKNKDEFDLETEYYFGGGQRTSAKVDLWQIIREIDSAIQHYDDDFWMNPKIVTLDLYIEELIKSKDSTDEMIRNSDPGEPDGEGNSYTDMLIEGLEEENEKITKFQKYKSDGYTSILHIDFGDNHGSVQGGAVGYAMDYEGREISIDDDCLIVFTEQNR